VVAAALLLLGGIATYLLSWDRYVETGLGRWAVAEVAERTGGVYRLDLGDLDFRPMAGSMSFDSAIVVTDTALDRARGAPLPVLSVRAVGCRISRVSVLGLMLGKRFTAHAMGCQSVFAAIDLVTPRSGTPPAKAPPKAPPKTPQDSLSSDPRPVLRPPLGIRKFQISNIAFPALQFSLRRHKLKGEASFEIEHARFVGKRVDLDVTATPGTPEAFSSVGLRLEASHLLFKPDPLTALSLDGIDIGITDSTLSVSRLALAPTVTDEEWQRKQKVRHDRIRVSLDTLAAAGVAYRTLVRTGEVHVRRVMLRGARLDVLSDKRLPAAAGPKKVHASPQASAQEVAPAVRIDTIVVDSSEVSYSERKPDKERPGRLDFKSLAVRISDVHLPSSGPPLAIDASTRLMGQGVLSVHATVPLDAPDFRFALTGRLGPMPIGALNPFLTETMPVKIKDGQIDSVIFAMNATGGANAITLTPYFRDLGIDITNPKGNVRGFVKAGLIEVGANSLKVRSRNPDSPKDRPRTAKVSRRYEPSQSWISFLWLSLRDGLLKVVVK
jgi:hypothetical protein